VCEGTHDELNKKFMVFNKENLCDLHMPISIIGEMKSKLIPWLGRTGVHTELWCGNSLTNGQIQK
jgi:hypothetical protein